MTDRPSRMLAELLEDAQPEHRVAIMAWMLEGGLTPSTAIGRGSWSYRYAAPEPTDPADLIRDLGPGNSQLVTVRLPQDVHAQLRDWCATQGFTMAAVIRGLVERFLAGQQPPPSDAT